MDNVYLVAGLACLIGAVVGGGLKAFGIEVPVLASRPRQIALGVLGVALIAVGTGGFRESLLGSLARHPEPKPEASSKNPPVPKRHPTEPARILITGMHGTGASGDPPGGWELYNDSSLMPMVEGINGSSYLVGRGQGSGVYIIKKVPDVDVNYALGDPAAIWSFRGRVGQGNANRSVAVAIEFENPEKVGWDGVWFGLQSHPGTSPCSFIGQLGGVEIQGGPFAIDHWYDIKLVVEFHNRACKATLYVKDRETGGDFVKDNRLADVSLPLPLGGDGLYHVKRVWARIDDNNSPPVAELGEIALSRFAQE
jgi:hypothetical protein